MNGWAGAGAVLKILDDYFVVSLRLIPRSVDCWRPWQWGEWYSEWLRPFHCWARMVVGLQARVGLTRDVSRWPPDRVGARVRFVGIFGSGLDIRATIEREIANPHDKFARPSRKECHHKPCQRGGYLSSKP